MEKYERYCKLVLGNGFDLYCGLKTKYSDFFGRDGNDINLIDEWIKKVDETLFRLTDEREVEIYIPKNSPKSTVTFWDLMFYLEFLDKKKVCWCNVEEFILNFFTEKTIEIADKKITRFDALFETLERQNILCNELKYHAIYLINRKIKCKNKKDFAIFLLEELNVFELKFGEYVQKELEMNLTKYKDNVTRFLKEICLRWKINSIDTFNYTGLEEIFIEDLFMKLSNCVHHVNGDYNYPIFGIDSSLSNVNRPEFIFTKNYRRMIGDLFEDNPSSFVDDEFTDLVIFGHSLNEQDYNYYFPIFDYMKLMDVTSKKGLYFYYNIYDEKKSKMIKNDVIRNIIKLINDYEKFKLNKNDNYRLVEALTSQGRLKLIKI